MDYKGIIPKAFWHSSEPTPVAYTVGDLIDELKRLPEELEIKVGFGDGAKIVVFNVGQDDIHVELCELDDDDDDDFGEDDDE